MIMGNSCVAIQTDKINIRTSAQHRVKSICYTDIDLETNTLSYYHTTDSGNNSKGVVSL